MNNIKVIVLGYGLLGKELVKQTNWDYISRKKDVNFDFKHTNTYKKNISSYDVVVNCVANTDTYDNDKKKHWQLNYEAVSELVDICNINNQKLVHISTDYVYSGSNENASELDVPVHNKTWYGYTKLLGDAHVQLKSNHYLLIRCGHKVKPFAYDKAFTDMYGNFDYVDKIASLIIKLVNNRKKGLINLGTNVKSMHDLAHKTKPDVLESKCSNELMPKNITMNISKLEDIL